MQEQARVVIIGGGVMGVSLLYHLSEQGWHDCVLLEKTELTAGSTWHAAGLCTHYAHNPTVMEMRAASVRLYRDILPSRTAPDGTRLDAGFHACGALRVTRSKERMDEFRHVRGLGDFVGHAFHLIGIDELRSLYPLCQTDGLIGALWEPHDGHVDPSLATQAMATLARANGARILRGTQVTGVERQGDEWLVRTPELAFRAEHVVNAAGTWCREVGTMMGVDLPVVPMLHQYLVTDRVPEVAERQSGGHPELPMIRDLEESWYVRQERDGFIVGPYEKNATPWSIDGVPPSFGMELLPPELDRVESIVELTMQRVPVLARAGIKTVVNGPITFTPDANPLIGPAFGLDNAWLLTGSSMGVMEGGGAGAFLAAWMTSGAPPMDPAAVDARRFGAYANRDYRVAKAIECFGLQFGVHYPYEERPAGRPLRTTPILDRQRERGAVLGCVYGFERPNWFDVPPARGGEPRETALSFRRPGWMDAVSAECLAVRDAVGLADLCAFAKFEVSGEGADAFMASLGANRPPSDDGRIALVHALTPAGGVASEFTVTRLRHDHFYLTSAAAAERHDADLLRRHAAHLPGVRIHNRTLELGILALMGPLAQPLLETLVGARLDDFAWLRCRQLEIGALRIRALRVSYVGEHGYELHVPLDALGALYDAITEIGEPLGLRPFGAFAMNAMRLEKGYRAWGADLTTERTPLEAGLEFAVKTAGRDFPGRDALIERRQSPDAWHMAPVRMGVPTNVVPFYGHTIFCGKEPVGTLTSGAFGPRVNETVGLAYFRAGAPADGLTIEIVGERHPLSKLAEAAYDARNSRPRGEQRPQAARRTDGASP